MAGWCTLMCWCTLTPVLMTGLCRVLLVRGAECQNSQKLTHCTIKNGNWVSLSEMDEEVQVLPACNLNDLRKPPSIWLCFSDCPNSRFGDFAGELRRKFQGYDSTSGFHYPTYISDRENRIMWFLYFSSHGNFLFHLDQNTSLSTSAHPPQVL